MMSNTLQVDVVVGAHNPYSEQIQKACISHGFVYHEQTLRIAELMADADLAIGAGGSASWERCCLGLPALLVALAENQIEIAKALDSIGACVYLGTKDEADLSTLQQAVTNLLATHNKLEITSRHALALVDGMGVSRVCQIFVC